VKWFNERKGYGFITRPSGGSDLFVYYTDINGEGFKTLKEGAMVEFDVVKGDKGLKAVAVEPVKS
jgi:CspA family cold shock protein